jgi:hypothetical protein
VPADRPHNAEGAIVVSGIARSSSAAAFRRHAFRLFGMPFVVAVAACCAVILIGYFRLGTKFPGIIELALSSLRYWTPLLFIVFFIFPSIRALLLVRRLTLKARAHGMRWYEYLDLSPDERNRLNEIVVKG